MGLIREPKNVNLVIKSKPWTEDELNELSAIIREAKAVKKRRTRKSEKSAKIKSASSR